MSGLLIPGLLCFLGLWGLARRVDVYAALSAGAAEGLRVLLRIFPPLVALLTAVSMLREKTCTSWRMNWSITKPRATAT